MDAGKKCLFNGDDGHPPTPQQVSHLCKFYMQFDNTSCRWADVEWCVVCILEIVGLLGPGKCNYDFEYEHILLVYISSIQHAHQFRVTIQCYRPYLSYYQNKSNISSGDGLVLVGKEAEGGQKHCPDWGIIFAKECIYYILTIGLPLCIHSATMQ